MDFSYKTISTLINEGRLNENEIFAAFKDRKFILRIKKDSIGEGFNINDKICELIEDDFIKRRVSVNGIIRNDIAAYNICYVLPKIFLSSEINKPNFFSQIENIQYIKILTRKPIVLHILEEFEIYSKILSPNKLFFFLLSAQKHNVISPKKESTLIETIIGRIKNTEDQADLLEGFLKRQENLFKNSTNTNITPDSKVAVIIAGQLRGYEKTLPRLLDLFEDVSNIDIFVSTWVAIGYPRATRQNLYRIFDKESIEWVKNNIDAERINNRLQNFLPQEGDQKKIADNIKKIFAKSSLKINIENENDAQFSGMTNPEKMYYHNNFWVNELGKEFFRENYNFIIKARPDILLEKDNVFLNRATYSDTAIYTEEKNGWIYRDWGFGCGDQMFYGTPENIIPMLSVYNDDLNISLTKKFSSSGSGFLGHVNIGIQAWLYGLNCLPMSFIHKGLRAAKLLNINEAVELLSFMPEKKS